VLSWMKAGLEKSAIPKQQDYDTRPDKHDILAILALSEPWRMSDKPRSRLEATLTQRTMPTTCDVRLAFLHLYMRVQADLNEDDRAASEFLLRKVLRLSERPAPQTRPMSISIAIEARRVFLGHGTHARAEPMGMATPIIFARRDGGHVARPRPGRTSTTYIRERLKWMITAILARPVSIRRVGLSRKPHRFQHSWSAFAIDGFGAPIKRSICSCRNGGLICSPYLLLRAGCVA